MGIAAAVPAVAPVAVLCWCCAKAVALVTFVVAAFAANALVVVGALTSV